MNKYKHKQIGYLMLHVTLVTTLTFVWLSLIISKEEGGIWVTMFMALIIFILLSFSTLQTIVDEKYVRIKFGYGLFRKRFPLSEIASAKSVKNHWYYGWGIRVWFWPYMWIYNVSGFDAVELVMKNGRIYRIGTDAPQELEVEINKHLNK